MAERLVIQKRALSANDLAAAALRREFAARRLLVLNLMSSPGSGKTTLLERTAPALAGEFRMAVIEGDLQTERDAERVRRAGLPATQINTGGGCHLDVPMVRRALGALPLDQLDILFIENVGNLVCPAAFDLGEDAAVLLASVAEGDDKPGKYPTAFRRADVVLLTKTDFLPVTEFRVDRFLEDVAKIKAGLPVLPMSCRTGQGVEAWFDWLRRAVAGKRAAP
ncbi:MAG: hydrogenase nickel incorporation protein HypB [Lentisphaeria bacterium]